MSTGGFVVANTNDLQLHETTIFRSEAAAVQAMKSVVAGKPELKGKLQVVSESIGGVMANGGYSFLPWLRRGIASEIREPASFRSRATVRVSATASDGVDTAGSAPTLRAARPRRRDRGRSAEHRPQRAAQLGHRFRAEFPALVEFYEEDFRGAIRRWPGSRAASAVAVLTLLVVEEGEFEHNNAPGRPLTSIRIKLPNTAELFPPPDQIWAWAHVQIPE